MGNQRRLIVSLAAALLLSAAHGCSEDPVVEQRRELLQGRDRRKEAREAVEKARVRSQAGDLLPSETKAAGIVLPRGFALKYSFEHRWYFDGDLPMKKVEEYFSRRLQFDLVNHISAQELELTQAREKADPAMAPVFVRLEPVPGRATATRIQVVEQVKEVAVSTSEGESLHRLAESRKHAR
jgi:hypothetical protein